MKRIFVGLFVILAVTSYTLALKCKACDESVKDLFCTKMVDEECKKEDGTAGICVIAKVEATSKLILCYISHFILHNMILDEIIRGCDKTANSDICETVKQKAMLEDPKVNFTCDSCYTDFCNSGRAIKVEKASFIGSFLFVCVALAVLQ